MSISSFLSNYPTQQVMDDIFRFIREKNIRPRFGAKYRFDEIREACVALDGGRVNGKLIITMD